MSSKHCLVLNGWNDPTINDSLSLRYRENCSLHPRTLSRTPTTFLRGERRNWNELFWDRVNYKILPMRQKGLPGSVPLGESYVWNKGLPITKGRDTEQRTPDTRLKGRLGEQRNPTDGANRQKSLPRLSTVLHSPSRDPPEAVTCSSESLPTRKGTPSKPSLQVDYSKRS